MQTITPDTITVDLPGGMVASFTRLIPDASTVYVNIVDNGKLAAIGQVDDCAKGTFGIGQALGAILQDDPFGFPSLMAGALAIRLLNQSGVAL